MTDGSPLVNIRKTLARMKQEVYDQLFNFTYNLTTFVIFKIFQVMAMDVRIGVVEHTLLQVHLKKYSLH